LSCEESFLSCSRPLFSPATIASCLALRSSGGLRSSKRCRLRSVTRMPFARNVLNSDVVFGRPSASVWRLASAQIFVACAR